MKPRPPLDRAGRFPRVFAWIGYSICVVVVVFALLSIAARVGLALWPHLHQPTITDMVPGNPVYANYAWAPDCMKEQLAKERNRYVPFLMWGNSEVHGTCLNNDVTPYGVFRRTINPANCGSRHVELWVLGGSAAYGTMLPDWATLPSALSRILNSGEQCVQVTNLAVEGYNSNQELLLLIQQLKAGHVPNLVLFYDGFNDADIGTSPPGPATHLGYQSVKHRLEGKFAIYPDLLSHLVIWQLADQLTRSHGRKPLPRVAASELPARASATLDNYTENLRIARVLGQTYGFQVCAFWQPALIYGHKPLVGYEPEFLRLSSQPQFFFQPLASVYGEAERRAKQNGKFVFLGNALDRSSLPLYLDWVHLNPDGNVLMARAVAGHLEGCMSAR